MPTITTATQTYNGAQIECAYFNIDKASTYRLTGRFGTESEMNGDYAWQMVIRANAARTVTVKVGDKSANFSVTTAFQRLSNVYLNVTVTDSPYVDISFPAGQYWLYHTQLEMGNTVTDWHPHNDDTVDEAVAKANENPQIKEWVTNYATRLDQTDTSIKLLAEKSVTTTDFAELREYTVSNFEIQAGSISMLNNQFIALDNNVTSKYSLLESSINGLTSRVGSTETNIANNYSTTAEMNSAIEQKANSITSTVSETYVTQTSAANTYSTKSDTANNINDAVNGINIGGRNLLPSTETYGMDSGDSTKRYAYHSSISFSSSTDGTSDIASWSAATTLAYRALQSRPPILYSQVRNKTVTFSMYIRSSSASSFASLATSQGWFVTLALCANTSTSLTRTRYANILPISRTISTEWTKVYATADINDAWFTSGSGTISENNGLYVQVYNYTLLPIQVKQLKLEIGNKATDWSPAYADYSSTVTMSTMVSSMIEQKADSITSTVSQTYLTKNDAANTYSTKSQVTQTANSITMAVFGSNSDLSADNLVNTINNASKVVIQPGHINLSGYVTFNNLSSVKSTTNTTTIDGSHLTTGIIQDSGGNTVFNLNSGELKITKGSIKLGTNGEFNVTDKGAVKASNIEITGGSLNLNGGNLIIDKDGNIYSKGNIFANKIYGQDSNGNSSTSTYFHYGTDPDYNSGKSDIMIADSLLAKNLIITGGLINLSATNDKSPYKDVDSSPSKITISDYYSISSTSDKITSYIGSGRIQNTYTHSETKATIQQFAKLQYDGFLASSETKNSSGAVTQNWTQSYGIDGIQIVNKSRKLIFRAMNSKHATADAHVVFGTGEIIDTEQTGTVRFLDKVTLPDGGSSIGTNIYDNGKIKTLETYIKDHSSGSGTSTEIDTSDFAKKSSNNDFKGSNTFSGNSNTFSKIVYLPTTSGTTQGVRIGTSSNYTSLANYISGNIRTFTATQTFTPASSYGIIVTKGGINVTGGNLQLVKPSNIYFTENKKDLQALLDDAASSGGGSTSDAPTLSNAAIKYITNVTGITGGTSSSIKWSTYGNLCTVTFTIVATASVSGATFSADMPTNKGGAAWRASLGSSTEGASGYIQIANNATSISITLSKAASYYGTMVYPI